MGLTVIRWRHHIFERCHLTFFMSITKFSFSKSSYRHGESQMKMGTEEKRYIRISVRFLIIITKNNVQVKIALI